MAGPEFKLWPKKRLMISASYECEQQLTGFADHNVDVSVLRLGFRERFVSHSQDLGFMGNQWNLMLTMFFIP